MFSFVEQYALLSKKNGLRNPHKETVVKIYPCVPINLRRQLLHMPWLLVQINLAMKDASCEPCEKMIKETL